MDIIADMLIEVRRVCPGEWIILKDLRLAALLDSPAAFGSKHDDEANRPDDEWQMRARRSSTGDDITTFIALNNNRAIGLVTGYRQPESHQNVELVSMWTAPEARRFGAGRQLVQAVIDWAAESRVSAIGLWVMRDNPSAERLYDSMGFQEPVNFRPQSADPCANELRMSLTLEHPAK